MTTFANFDVTIEVYWEILNYLAKNKTTSRDSRGTNDTYWHFPYIFKFYSKV